MSFLSQPLKSASSSDASFFAQRRARNACDTRVIGDEVQGPFSPSRLPLRARGGLKVIMAPICVYVSRANFTTKARLWIKILCICTLCTWVFFSKQLSWEFIYVTFVESLNLITDPKCNKILKSLNVITFHPKYKKVDILNSARRILQFSLSTISIAVFCLQN